MFSRCQTGGRPGERTLFRVHRSEARWGTFITTSLIRVLRRPVEFAQFTSVDFTRVLIDNKIAISMDGKGSWRDNVFVERLWKSVKYEEVVCCERPCLDIGRGRCFTRDEGRPLEVGLQEQASNRHELHWSRASVVNVDGKGGARLRQVRFRETNESEPLMTCRNVLNDVETGTRTSVPRIKVERNLFTAQPASGMKAA
jgi:hypothetical protein